MSKANRGRPSFSESATAFSPTSHPRKLFSSYPTAVAPTPYGTGARASHFYIWMGTGAPWVEEQQTRNWSNCILTITKALTKTTNCAFRAKKRRDTTKKKFFPALSAGSVPLQFCSGPVPPHFQIRSAPLLHGMADDFESTAQIQYTSLARIHELKSLNCWTDRYTRAHWHQCRLLVSSVASTRQTHDRDVNIAAASRPSQTWSHICASKNRSQKYVHILWNWFEQTLAPWRCNINHKRAMHTSKIIGMQRTGTAMHS